jgi:hypothetical protein
MAFEQLMAESLKKKDKETHADKAKEPHKHRHPFSKSQGKEKESQPGAADSKSDPSKYDPSQPFRKTADHYDPSKFE